jgi:hypothetical protein
MIFLQIIIISVIGLKYLVYMFQAAFYLVLYIQNILVF